MRQPRLPLQQPVDGLADAAAPPLLVFVVGELTREQERIEGEPVACRGDVRADDIRARRCAGAGKQRQQAWMVGSEDRELAYRRKDVRVQVRRQLPATLLGAAQQPRVLDLLSRIGPQPIVLIMAADEALNLLGRPIREGPA